MEDIRVELCGKNESFLIQRMIQLYYYDLHTHSNLASLKLHQAQYSDMPYFENYWSEENRFPYLIYQAKEPIGFALVHDITVNPALTWKLSEFFVMGPFRRKGVASRVFSFIQKQHIGSWEISVLKDNTPALKFWENELKKIGHSVLQDEFPQYIFYEVHA